MSLTDQENQGADTADTPAATTDVTNADPSTATNEGELSVTDAVLAALGDDEETPASNDEGSNAEASADENSDGGEDGSADEDDADKTALTEKETAALNDRTRTRIETLLDQRKEKAEEVQTLQTRVEELEPVAERYQTLTNFMQENRVSAEDASSALQLAGLIQTDPSRAYEALKPIMDALSGQLGLSLAQDLADDVAAGRITQARAEELSQSRASAALTERQATAQREQQAKAEEDAKAQRENDERAQHVARMTTLGDQLAADKEQSDPDWKLKEPIVVDKLRIDLTDNGLPKDEADLRKRFDDAVKSATETLRSMNPNKKRPVVPKTGGTPADVKTEAPTTALEAVEQALG